VCGIGGTIGGGPPDPDVLARMAAAMAHRGPDGQGVWHDGVAGLAFRRLAIIDLDARSDQPLHLGPWHLVFNGEVYDYRERRAELEALGHTFVTEGDGEVLLHAWAEWGEQALERINGMFAFAIWHEQRRELTLCSDPFGEKPLYWCRDGERLAFASDIRALRTAVPSLGAANPAALGRYLARGLMPPIDDSFFAGVNRLPGAHLLRFANGREHVVRYWTPQAVEVPADYPDAVARLRDLLVDSIRLRLRSDVPVGTSLSGGVDSSAVAALAGRLEADATRHAFTASFPGFERDEWRYAEQVATTAGVVEHHRVLPTVDELARDLDALVRDQEEPFGSLSIYAQWRVNQAAHEAGVTVLLDGQGGDELFAGYAGIRGWALRAQGPRAVGRALLAGGSDRRDLLTALGAERLPRASAHRHRRRLVTPYAAPDVADAAVRVEPPQPAGGAGSSPLRRELLRQSFHTSLPMLLRYADRNSMAHSREVRLPLLDRRIAEFALSAPPAFLVGAGATKRILRDAVADVVPAAVLARRDKVGFEPPQARWLQAPALRERARDVLLDRETRSRGLYDIAAIEADARAGAWRDPTGLWRALNLELWLRACTGAPTTAPARAAA
jgi:asparagine synthase (glutamine-hydrolysing)